MREKIDIWKGRWRLLGHIMGLREEKPAVKAMKVDFERSGKVFRGRPRETIEITIKQDLQYQL